MGMAGVILKTPDFKLPAANPSALYPDTLWWLWLHTKRYVGDDLALGGIYANKSGFHNTGNENKKRWPNNYSIRDKVNQSGPGMTKASALDLTFRSAQSGNYKNIDTISSRLLASMLDPRDPRLDMFLFEFYGQTDNDIAVEGYNEHREDSVSSDPSHLWHIHESALRSLLGSWWGAWATYTVHCGLSVVQWRATLPNATPPPPKPKPVPVPAGIPTHTLGAHEVKEGHKGTDVVFWQKFIGSKRMGVPDGMAGPKFTAGIRWYQGMRGLKVDGIVGDRTWAQAGH